MSPDLLALSSVGDFQPPGDPATALTAERVFSVADGEKASAVVVWGGNSRKRCPRQNRKGKGVVQAVADSL